MSTNTIDINGIIAVITIKQDLVASTVNDLRTMIKGSISDGVKNISVDLSGIKIVDSMGIGLLISTQNSLAKVGGSLEIVNISADIMDLFQSMRLGQHFTLKGE